MQQGRILRQAAVGGREFSIGNHESFCLDHRPRSSPKKFGTICPKGPGDPVQFLNQVVIHLYEYLTRGHDHTLVPILHA